MAQAQKKTPETVTLKSPLGPIVTVLKSNVEVFTKAGYKPVKAAPAPESE